MVRVNLGMEVSGERLEEVLINSATDMGFSYSVDDFHGKEYMLNPVRIEEIYRGSRLEIKGLCSHFRVDFNREASFDYFFLDDIIAQESETDVRVATMLLKDIPEEVKSPEAYLEDYLNFVSIKLYEKVK